LAAALLLPLVVACGAPDVVRITDGHVAHGRFIDERAYAAFLLGALADESGELTRAEGYYSIVISRDPSDAEAWARRGRARCRRSPGDPAAEEDIEHALSLDASSPASRLARQVCDAVRVGGAEAADLATLRFEAGLLPLPLAHERTREATEEERERVIGLTLLHKNHLVAWDALLHWGLSHGDTPLAVRGMIGVATLAPTRRFELAQSAVWLAGGGHLSAARALSAALIDADGDRSSGGEGPSPASVPLVARLALDEALVRRDAERVRARAVRAHIGLDVAAGRAWALGDSALASDLIALPWRAAPSSIGPRIVHEGAAGRASSGLLASVPAGRLPLDVGLPLARDLLAREGVAAAARATAASEGLRDLLGDPVLVPLAVELVLAGVLADGAVSSDARIEIAARRNTSPQGPDLEDRGLDARHRLLALALLRPRDAATIALAAQLTSAAGEDRLVAVALAKIALAGGPPIDAVTRGRLDSAAASDAIAAAALVDLARHDGAGPRLATARSRLAALARTPAEHERAAE
jgi:hypothetical protein